MCLTFGFSWIGTTSSPASMQRAFRLFASPSHVHFDGQKPIVVVVKSARSSNNDECPINPEVLLFIDDDVTAAMINFLLFLLLFYSWILSLFSAHFILLCHGENDIAWSKTTWEFFRVHTMLSSLIWAFFHWNFSHELQIERNLISFTVQKFSQAMVSKKNAQKIKKDANMRSWCGIFQQSNFMWWQRNYFT